jgi:amino acid adenylation domain-containing protein
MGASVEASAEEANAEGDADAAPGIASVGGPGDYPVSPAQRALYTQARLDPAGLAYNQPGGLMLDGPVDPDRMQAAFTALVTRHEALRTVFAVDEAGVPYQRVLPPDKVEARLERAEAPAPSDPAPDTLPDEVVGDFLRPFDLATAPLIRLRLVTLTGGERPRSVLLFDAHHAVVDGQSLTVIVHDFCDLYAGRTLPAPPAGPKDWAAHLAARPTRTDHLQWWRDHLSGGVPALDLPADRPRPQATRFAGARLTAALPPDQATGIEHMARTAHTTEFAVWSAATSTLLSRYARTDQVVLATASAGRDEPGAAGVVGMLVQTLPLLLSPGRAGSFSQLVTDAGAETLQAIDHQDVGLDEIQAALRRPGAAPVQLTRAMVVLQNGEPPRYDLPGLAVRPFELETGTAKMDLAFVIAPTADGGRQIQLDYNTDLFDPATVQRLLGHLLAALKSALLAPATAPKDLDLLAPGERAAILSRLCDGPAAPPAQTLAELWAHQVAAHPGRPALTAWDSGSHATTLTYAQLDARARAIAARIGADRAPARAVAVRLDRTSDLVAATLGVSLAGAAWVPLDPAWPDARTRYVLQDSGVRAVVTDRPLPAGALPVAPPAVIRLDLGADTPVAVRGADAGRSVSLEDVAYVIYTSGTTGRPKGVLVTHRGLAGMVRIADDGLGFTPRSRVLGYANSVWDSSVIEWFGALLGGASLVLVPEFRRTDPAWLNQLIRDRQVTAAVLTPAVAALLDLSPLDSFANCGAAGRPLPGYPGRDSHGYGPTEGTVAATVWVKPADAPWPAVVPIGRAATGWRVYVAEPTGALAGLGMPGELLISGPGLAAGYLGRPDLTAAAFPPNPYLGAPTPATAGDPYAHVYHTGDLVRWNGDDQLVYLGRTDAQVKIRGVRVEPAETEAVLLELPGIQQAAVVPVSGPDGELQLAAYVVPGPGATCDPPALLGELARRLPPAQLPASVTPLDRLPLLASGKLDRAGLPEPAALPARAHVKPESPEEKLVAGAFADVLDQAEVGADDDFLLLGGDSLKAIQVVSRLMAAGLTVTVREVMEGRTVRAIAEAATPAPAATTAPSRPRTAARPAAPGLNEADIEILNRLAASQIPPAGAE